MYFFKYYKAFDLINITLCHYIKKKTIFISKKANMRSVYFPHKLLYHYILNLSVPVITFLIFIK